MQGYKDASWSGSPATAELSTQLGDGLWIVNIHVIGSFTAQKRRDGTLLRMPRFRQATGRGWHLGCWRGDISGDILFLIAGEAGLESSLLNHKPNCFWSIPSKENTVKMHNVFRENEESGLAGRSLGCFRKHG